MEYRIQTGKHISRISADDVDAASRQFAGDHGLTAVQCIMDLIEAVASVGGVLSVYDADGHVATVDEHGFCALSADREEEGLSWLHVAGDRRGWGQ